MAYKASTARRSRKPKSAAQIAAAKKNLEKARAARARKAKTTVPVKKVPVKRSSSPKPEMVTLYHYTTKGAARSILKEGFRPKSQLGMPPSEDVFFMPRKNAIMDALGIPRGKQAIVSVRVPKKIVSPDKWHSPGEEGAVQVKLKDLTGVKISGTPKRTTTRSRRRTT